MAKIIKFDTTLKKPETVDNPRHRSCDHKHVIAFTVYRTVRCAACGIELDPFDVLVDILKTRIQESDSEEQRLLKEVNKREGKGVE